MKKVTRRNFLARAVRSVSDKELIHQQNLALDHALQEFSVTSLMRLQVTSAVETDDYEKLKQTDIQLLEEVACPTDGPYLRIHRARIRSNGTVVRVLQHNDTVSVSEFLADLRRYQKMFHPNVEQLLGASPRTAPTKFVVVEDYPHQVDEILLSNPCALSLHERVRLALKAMTDILASLGHNSCRAPH
ncbi:hypothetical protein PLICRDRAFT_346169 [Plicaturopsis crispa FD-325 SS-3]|uniref:Protein kinase domain-containing protein n=1 Tax=Plicaturopsis crispa FD-325 SS-3 TaxID=944288 RepID=A0A0C9T9H2_PLICR|nr:hypothetical protein PLICRDRAFT_346169 [Plicaturopsis crispa FD-325 SS-3]